MNKKTLTIILIGFIFIQHMGYAQVPCSQSVPVGTINTGQQGITVFGGTHPGTTSVVANLDIHNNDYIARITSGIQVRNVEQTSIFNNAITLTNNSHGKGIYLYNSKDSEVIGNLVSIDNNSQTGRGILIEDSPNTIVQENSVEGVHSGISFLGDYTDITLQCNTLKDCVRGVFFNGNVTAPATSLVVAGQNITQGSDNIWDNCNNDIWITTTNSALIDWYHVSASANPTPASIYFPSNNIGNNQLTLIPVNNYGICNPPPFMRIDNNSLDNELISLYPNPAENNINIYAIEQGKIEIYNSIGKKIIESTLLNGLQSINISHLQAGIYFYTIYGVVGIHKKGKLIKIR